MKIYLVRHGQVPHNALKKYCDWDEDLNEIGIIQAEELAYKIKNLQYDIVLVQLKPEHLDYFDQFNIKYSIAYPNLNNWSVVEKRCKDRNNNEKFIKRLKEVFELYYIDSSTRDYEKLYILDNDMTLEKCLEADGIELKR